MRKKILVLPRASRAASTTEDADRVLHIADIDLLIKSIDRLVSQIELPDPPPRAERDRRSRWTSSSAPPRRPIRRDRRPHQRFDAQTSRQGERLFGNDEFVAAREDGQGQRVAQSDLTELRRRHLNEKSHLSAQNERLRRGAAIKGCDCCCATPIRLWPGTCSRTASCTPRRRRTSSARTRSNHQTSLFRQLEASGHSVMLEPREVAA